MNLWNTKCLEPPPIATYKTNSYREIRQLRSCFKKAVDFFNNQSILEKEAALLSRCIYRMKMKFRSDKGLKTMEKLNHALLQFNYLNIRGILDDFYTILPKEKTTDLYLPTRNMLDFILVRLQGTAYLMSRAIEVAQIAASSMGSRICIGQFWKVALIMLGIASRIWIICKKILKTTCDFYNNILPMHEVLKNIGKDWLPDDYTFPNDLQDLLNVDLHNNDSKLDLGSFKSIVPVTEIIGNSDINECGKYVQGNDIVDKRQLDNVVNMYDKISTFELLLNDEDLGEVISEPTKAVRNIVNISSDSEDDVNMINETFTSFKRKQTTITEDNNNNNKRKNQKRAVQNKEKIKDVSKLHEINVGYEKTKINKSDRTFVENDRLHHKKDPRQNKFKIKGNKQTSSAKDVIENISSLKELKIFMKKESKCRESQQLKGVLQKMDKLQWIMLKKHVKKFIKRANNNIITVSQCLIDVKETLKAGLGN